MMFANRVDITPYGCPVGTLCAELAKLNHALQDAANKLFTVYRTWLARQFALLGRGADADELAMHLLGRSQGVAMLANAFHDEKFIEYEAGLMCDWLTTQEHTGANQMYIVLLRFSDVAHHTSLTDLQSRKSAKIRSWRKALSPGRSSKSCRHAPTGAWNFEPIPQFLWVDQARVSACAPKT